MPSKRKRNIWKEKQWKDFSFKFDGEPDDNTTILESDSESWGSGEDSFTKIPSPEYVPKFKIEARKSGFFKVFGRKKVEPDPDSVAEPEEKSPIKDSVETVQQDRTLNKKLTPARRRSNVKSNAVSTPICKTSGSQSTAESSWNLSPIVAPSTSGIKQVYISNVPSVPTVPPKKPSFRVLSNITVVKPDKNKRGKIKPTQHKEVVEKESTSTGPAAEGVAHDNEDNKEDSPHLLQMKTINNTMLKFTKLLEQQTALPKRLSVNRRRTIVKRRKSRLRSSQLWNQSYFVADDSEIPGKQPLANNNWTKLVDSALDASTDADPQNPEIVENTPVTKGKQNILTRISSDKENTTPVLKEKNIRIINNQDKENIPLTGENRSVSTVRTNKARATTPKTDSNISTRHSTNKVLSENDTNMQTKMGIKKTKVNSPKAQKSVIPTTSRVNQGNRTSYPDQKDEPTSFRRTNKKALTKHTPEIYDLVKDLEKPNKVLVVELTRWDNLDELKNKINMAAMNSGGIRKSVTTENRMEDINKLNLKKKGSEITSSPTHNQTKAADVKFTKNIVYSNKEEEILVESLSPPIKSTDSANSTETVNSGRKAIDEISNQLLDEIKMVTLEEEDITDGPKTRPLTRSQRQVTCKVDSTGDKVKAKRKLGRPKKIPASPGTEKIRFKNPVNVPTTSAVINSFKDDGNKVLEPSVTKTLHTEKAINVPTGSQTETTSVDSVKDDGNKILGPLLRTKKPKNLSNDSVRETLSVIESVKGDTNTVAKKRRGRPRKNENTNNKVTPKRKLIAKEAATDDVTAREERVPQTKKSSKVVKDEQKPSTSACSSVLKEKKKKQNPLQIISFLDKYCARHNVKPARSQPQPRRQIVKHLNHQVPEVPRARRKRKNEDVTDVEPEVPVEIRNDQEVPENMDVLESLVVPETITPKQSPPKRNKKEKQANPKEKGVINHIDDKVNKSSVDALIQTDPMRSCFYLPSCSRISLNASAPTHSYRCNTCHGKEKDCLLNISEFNVQQYSGFTIASGVGWKNVLSLCLSIQPNMIHPRSFYSNLALFGIVMKGAGLMKYNCSVYDLKFEDTFVITPGSEYTFKNVSYKEDLKIFFTRIQENKD